MVIEVYDMAVSISSSFVLHSATIPSQSSSSEDDDDAVDVVTVSSLEPHVGGGGARGAALREISDVDEALGDDERWLARGHWRPSSAADDYANLSYSGGGVCD